MIKVKEIAFVAYPVADKQRAVEFYEGLLGLKRTMDSSNPDGFWFEYDIGAGTLAISNFWKPTGGDKDPTGPTVGVEVEDFDGTMTALRENGIAVKMEPMEAPMCRFALVVDPDGNPIFIHKRKTT